MRTRGEQIRKFVLEHVGEHPSEITKVVAEQFSISRQAANKHLRRLVTEGALVVEGRTQNQKYKLAPLLESQHLYTIGPDLAEDIVWRDDIAPRIGAIPDNARRIWEYGFQEMFNNAIDHSEGRLLRVQFVKTAATTEIMILDDGVGIFKKIQAALGLVDERHSVLELAKGKLTTDPKRHSGEGIFFASRMFDDFQILSGGVYFAHEFEHKEDWIMERTERNGTVVFMKLNNHTSRTMKKVFDAFAGDADYGFTKTVVPVGLARYGDDNLVSRSQAKRLLSRVERFKTVMLDFKDVETIGQAFADEVFRVFASQHPEIELLELNTSVEVMKMISRARSHSAAT